MHTNTSLLGTPSVTALALFSGGLDSILAARLIMEQGITVHCLHFVSPFFGSAEQIPHWEKTYGLSISAIDLGETFVRILREGPENGFGKILNPCVDCKITMMRAAKERMAQYNAQFVLSGEVLGQRPMSQRRETLNLIRRQAEAEAWLLRPLSALHLDPTPMETAGIVDRTRLRGFSGRGRKEQLELAKAFKLREIPTPAGGCRLTERENAKRYWPVLHHYAETNDAHNFHLANVGRQVWSQQDSPESSFWLSIGRQQSDNARLVELAQPEDSLFKVVEWPGPIALARYGAQWSEALIEDAAAHVASFSPKAVVHAETGGVVQVRITQGPKERIVTVTPARATPAAWSEYPWEAVREHVRSVNCSLDAARKQGSV